VKKGAGELDGVQFEEVVYEGYAAGGIGVIVEVLTDNKNRTAAEVRHIFTKHGSGFAQPGAVSRGFHRKGQIFVDASSVAEDKLMDVVLEAGAEDMKKDGDQFEILTDPAAFANVTEALDRAGIKTLSAEVSLVPDVYIPVADKSVADAVMKFVSELEDNDDVRGVATNMDVDESVLKDLEEE